MEISRGPIDRISRSKQRFLILLCLILELIDPDSFNIALKQPEGYLFIFKYYSFVTITTLGYGDITPVSEVAKALSVLEAIVGQLYLVVVVAWLVGMHVSSRSKP